MWGAQAQVITQDDLLVASANGTISPDLLKRWRLAYASFVNNSLAAIWRQAAVESRQGVLDGLAIIDVVPRSTRFTAALDRWIDVRSASMIDSLAKSQERAVRNLLRYHIRNDPLSTANLSKVLRPVVSLSPRQELAVRRRRNLLIRRGVSGTDLDAQVGAYAEYQQRLRATLIARTELTAAYNNAGLDSVQDTIDQGLIKPTAEKEWLTAEDERVCAICAPLDGQVVPIKEQFDGGFDVPPAHPQCRCTAIYNVEAVG